MQVKALVQFLTENCCEIFGEEMAGLSSPSAEESPAPMGRSTGMRRDGGLSQPEQTAGGGLRVGFASAVVHFQQVTLLHVLLLARAAFGRGTWPCRRSRCGAPGKSPPGRTTLSARPPESSRGRHGAGMGKGRGRAAPQTLGQGVLCRRVVPAESKELLCFFAAFHFLWLWVGFFSPERSIVSETGKVVSQMR